MPYLSFESKHRRTLKLLASTALILSVFQVYAVNVAGLFVPLSLIASLLLAFYVDWKVVLKARVILLILALYSIQLSSLVWSPDKVMGMREVLFELPFAMAFGLGYTLVWRYRVASLSQPMQLYVIAAAVQSVLVIYFRLAPDAEQSFWAGRLAPLAINPNALFALFSEAGKNNVLDPDKAGGMILNGNVAGAWASLCFFITVALRWRRWFIVGMAIGAVHLGAVIASGSKASLALVACAIAVAFQMRYLARRMSVANRLMLMVAIVGAASALYLMTTVLLSGSDFAYESAKTLDVREIMWRHALAEFQVHPLLGHGFGGWGISFFGIGGASGASDLYPPHNAIVYLWSQSGLLAAVLGIAIILSYLRAFERASKCVQGWEYPLLGAGCIAVAAQSLGENYGVFGDVHASVAMGLILGAAVASSARSKVTGRLGVSHERT